MITTQEAFAEVQGNSHVLQYQPSIDNKVALWAAVRAGFLAAHVGACLQVKPDLPSNATLVQRTGSLIRCGDGWYCEKAKEIEELGK